MKAAGAKISWRIYPDFHHGFDNRRGVRFIANAATSRNCGVYVDLADLKVKRRLDNAVVDNPEALYEKCNERGAHTGGTNEQAEVVKADVIRILNEHLR